MKRMFLSILFAAILIGATFTSPPQAALGAPAAAGGCTASASGSVTIYNRPSTRAVVFSILPTGFSAQISARTEGGWLGFDPGIAQAANVGPFRLRWVQRKAVKLAGNCGNIPRVWGPPPRVCFDMPMEDVNVYDHPRTTAHVITVLSPGEFAGVVRRGSAGWVKLNLRQGNSGARGTGWVEESTLNVNGPCGF